MGFGGWFWCKDAMLQNTRREAVNGIWKLVLVDGCGRGAKGGG